MSRRPHVDPELDGPYPEPEPIRPMNVIARCVQLAIYALGIGLVAGYVTGRLTF